MALCSLGTKDELTNTITLAQKDTTLPPFKVIRFFNIVHIHIDVNKSRHTYMSRFINIYMNVSGARKSYNIK